MDRTLELRWFANEDTPPDRLHDWFDTLGDASQKERSDVYLLTAAPACNVKWRSGKIQTKRRVRAPNSAVTPTGYTGWQECWHKWSFKTDDAPPERDANLWVRMQKVRHQVTKLLPNDIVIKIELTRVKACNETAWSVCIEAESTSPTQPLADALGHAKYLWMSDLPAGLPFSEDTSMGYASWLHEVADHPFEAAPSPTDA